tara:strand:- start:718 stop:930 length:213 start_codon:yes stop_codon:yes gene_type:complete
MNNICINDTKASKEIRNIIDTLYDIQKNNFLSQNDIVSINDIIGTLQYKFQEPILGITHNEIFSTKGFIP